MNISAKTVAFDEDYMHVALMDGRRISVPLVWFPRLLDATPEQLAKVRIFGRGEGLNWEELDEDIEVASLMTPRAFEREAATAAE